MKAPQTATSANFDRWVRGENLMRPAPWRGGPAQDGVHFLGHGPFSLLHVPADVMLVNFLIL